MVENPDNFVPGHTACAGCGCAIAMRQIVNALGKDIIIVNATGCMEIVSSCYPRSAWNVPYIHVLFENIPAVASGIVNALRAKGNDHTTVVCIGGDGATYDIGFGALSGMLERNEDVLYVCYTNESYMNTGIQRSSATPRYANTTTSQVGKKIHGKQEWTKPIVEIVAAHKIPYAASTSISFFADVEKKLKKAQKMRGSRFIAIHASCNPGWRHEADLAYDICKLAVETGMWKLCEYENGEFELNYNPAQRKPVEEYLKLQGRFKHLTKEEIAEIQKRIDEEWKTFEGKQ